MSRIYRSPLSLADLEDHYVYIGMDNLAAAERFEQAVDEAFRKLADSPHLGRVYFTQNSKLEGLRVWIVPGFTNYLIFYRPLSDGIEVIRVIHGARDITAILGEP